MASTAEGAGFHLSLFSWHRACPCHGLGSIAGLFSSSCGDAAHCAALSLKRPFWLSSGLDGGARGAAPAQQLLAAASKRQRHGARCGKSPLLELWRFSSVVRSLSQRPLSLSKNLPHQAYTFLTCFFTVCAQGLPHPISDLWLLGHPRATLSSEVYNSNSLKGWPCTARILALAELLDLTASRRQPRQLPQALPAPAATRTRQVALYAGLSLRCCTLRHRGIAILQHRRTLQSRTGLWVVRCVKDFLDSTFFELPTL